MLQNIFTIVGFSLTQQQLLLVHGVSSWDPIQPWLISHPPNYLEARVCGCGQDGPWQRFALGADLYDAGSESWLPPVAGMPNAACHKKVAKKSTAVREFLRRARLNATSSYLPNFICTQKNCKCPGNNAIAQDVEEANLRRSVLSRGDPTRLQLFYKKLSQCSGSHDDSDPITVSMLLSDDICAHSYCIMILVCVSGCCSRWK